MGSTEHQTSIPSSQRYVQLMLLDGTISRYHCDSINLSKLTSADATTDSANVEPVVYESEDDDGEEELDQLREQAEQALRKEIRRCDVREETSVSRRRVGINSCLSKLQEARPAAVTGSHAASATIPGSNTAESKARSQLGHPPSDDATEVESCTEGLSTLSVDEAHEGTEEAHMSSKTQVCTPGDV